MKILVTGANGYLGQGIVQCLIDDGVTVIASDIAFSDGYDKRAIIKEGDLFDIDDPYSYYEEPDVLLHLAWRDCFSLDMFSHIEDLPKHFNFLKSMIHSGIKRVAVMGTIHEIGFYNGSVDENTPTNPMNYYGISKDSLRNMVNHLCTDARIPYQWLRAYYIVRTTEHGSTFFSKITGAEAKGQKLFPFTSGQNQSDYIDYSDFCAQVSAAVLQEEITGIINVCSGKPEKLADRAERFIRENNFKIRLDYGKYPERAYDPKAVWGDDTKIREILRRKNEK